AVTVDHLSGGRLDLRVAIGTEDAAARAAWQRHGIRYPAGAARVAAVGEALAIVRALWRGDSVSTDGPVFRLRAARLAPLPLLRPALIGDAGAVVARLAEYERAGATDLMLGFVDFPATTMLERLAAAALRPESAPDR